MRCWNNQIGTTVFITGVMLVLCLTVLAFVGSSQGQTAHDKIIGEWYVVFPATGSPNENGRVLTVKTEGNKLSAKTTFKEANGEQKEWLLIDPVLDSAGFLFKVNNGQEILEGKLKQVDDHFEGPWKASQSGATGTMRLVRKK